MADIRQNFSPDLMEEDKLVEEKEPEEKFRTELDEATQSDKDYLVTLCAEKGLNDFVEILLSAGADIRTSSTAFPTILEVCRRGKPAMLKLFLKEDRIDLAAKDPKFD